MPLSKEEKVVAQLLSDPRFPTACVEGEFKGERAVFVCLIDYHNPKKPTEGYDITPLAKVLEKHELKHVKGHEGQPLGAAPEKRIITPGKGGS